MNKNTDLTSSFSCFSKFPKFLTFSNFSNHPYFSSFSHKKILNPNNRRNDDLIFKNHKGLKDLKVLYELNRFSTMNNGFFDLKISKNSKNVYLNLKTKDFQEKYKLDSNSTKKCNVKRKSKNKTKLKLIKGEEENFNNLHNLDNLNNLNNFENCGNFRKGLSKSKLNERIIRNFGLAKKIITPNLNSRICDDLSFGLDRLNYTTNYQCTMENQIDKDKDKDKDKENEKDDNELLNASDTLNSPNSNLKNFNNLKNLKNLKSLEIKNSNNRLDDLVKRHHKFKLKISGRGKKKKNRTQAKLKETNLYNIFNSYSKQIQQISKSKARKIIKKLVNAKLFTQWSSNMKKMRKHKLKLNFTKNEKNENNGDNNMNQSIFTKKIQSLKLNRIKDENQVQNQIQQPNPYQNNNLNVKNNFYSNKEPNISLIKTQKKFHIEFPNHLRNGNANDIANENEYNLKSLRKYSQNSNFSSNIPFYLKESILNSTYQNISRIPVFEKQKKSDQGKRRYFELNNFPDCQNFQNVSNLTNLNNTISFSNNLEITSGKSNDHAKIELEKSKEDQITASNKPLTFILSETNFLHNMRKNSLSNKQDYKLNKLENFKNKEGIRSLTNKLRYKISFGNNSKLVHTVFANRYPHWGNADKDKINYNFRWEIWTKFINFKSISNNSISQMINHFEYNDQLTTKDKLFINLNEYCELNNIKIFEQVPLTFAFDISSKDYFNSLDAFYLLHNTISDFISKSKGDTEIDCTELNKVILTTFSDPSIPNYFDQDKNKNRNKIPRLNETWIKSSNLWIIKPTDYNRGEGVLVFDTINSLKKIIKELTTSHNSNNKLLDILLKDYNHILLRKDSYFKNKNENNKKNENQAYSNNKTIIQASVMSKKFIIQKYIENPLLYKCRKFDIRIWVLMNHEMKVYIFKEGYLRTSTQPFSLESVKILDKGIHLTNNAIQKNLKGYGSFEEGNQVSFNDFQIYLEEIQSGVNFRQKIYPQFKRLISLTTNSVRNKINLKNRNNSFEIFGYDFIIDEKYKVWLIEVNTTPCLEESSQLLKTLLPRMLSDAFRLTIDSFFYEHHEQSDNPKVDIYEVPGYNYQENLFEFVCDLKEKSKKKKKINTKT